MTVKEASSWLQTVERYQTQISEIEDLERSASCNRANYIHLPADIPIEYNTAMAILLTMKKSIEARMQTVPAEIRELLS